MSGPASAVRHVAGWVVVPGVMVVPGHGRSLGAHRGTGPGHPSTTAQCTPLTGTGLPSLGRVLTMFGPVLALFWLCFRKFSTFPVNLVLFR